jgi:uncharacterized protein YkwD
MICNRRVTTLPVILLALSFSTCAYADDAPLADANSTTKAVEQDFAAKDDAEKVNEDNYGKLNIAGVADSLPFAGQSYPGVKVTNVGSSGVGAQAHLAPGDILLTVNGFSISDDKQGEKILQAQPDGELAVSFGRNVDGQWQILSATVTHKKIQAPQSTTLYVIKSSRESSQHLCARMLDLVNSDRAEDADEEPLVLNEGLSELAQNLADDMVARDYFGHINPEGLGPQERAKKANLPAPSAETILSGAISVTEAESSFMEEPANDASNNRGRILNRHFKEIGIGIARKPDTTLVLVLEFSPGSKKGKKN